MNYTIATSITGNGFKFEPHELAALGITERSPCFAVWVEGRRFDDKCRLDAAFRLRNESPHLVISPIHPDLWPGAFSLQLMLERRVGWDEQIENTDAFFGMTDALKRCGVNTLFIRTSQIGYDITNVSLICDFPHLRPVIAALRLASDEAAAAVQSARARFEPLTPSPAALTALENADDIAFNRRTAAFQALGRLLLPRLTELEARLLAMDRWRYCYWEVDGRRKGRRHRAGMIADAANPSDFAMIVGRPPNQNEAIFDSAHAALETPWFLSGKVIEAGENPYFLSYSSSQVRAEVLTLLEQLGSPQEFQDIEPMDIEEFQHRTFNYLYETHILHRDLSPALKSAVAQSRISGKGHLPQPGSKERVSKIRKADYRAHCYEDFYRRQVFLPVKAAALPTLGYARIWALAGGQSPHRPLQLRFSEGLLRPDRIAGEVRSMTDFFDFLNTVTRCGADGPRFGDGAKVLASTNIGERFLRLRVCREAHERNGYLTVRLRYRRTAVARDRSPSAGLLNCLARILNSFGVRVDRCSDALEAEDAHAEAGVVEVVARAASETGLRTCSAFLAASDTERSAISRAWANDFVRLVQWAPTDLLEFTILPGISPINR
jgi:hypothetical protein